MFLLGFCFGFVDFQPGPFWTSWFVFFRWVAKIGVFLLIESTPGGSYVGLDISGIGRFMMLGGSSFSRCAWFISVVFGWVVLSWPYSFRGLVYL